jgi:glycogen synthase
MNILLLSMEYPPFVHHTGLGTHTRVLAESLVRDGHRVVVLSGRHSPAVTAELNGVTVILSDLRANWKPETGLLALAYERNKQLAETAIAAFRGTEFVPDVVHCQGSHGILAAEMLSTAFNCALVGTAHICFKFLLSVKMVSIVEEMLALEERLCIAPARIITVSAWLKSTIMSAYGVSADRVSVVHGGFDPEPPDALDRTGTNLTRQSLGLEAKTVGVFFGALNAQKGIFSVYSGPRN